MKKLSINQKVAIGLFISLSIFYGYTACTGPSGYADADEIVTSAYLFSPAHPPGYGINIILLGLFQHALRIWHISPAYAGNLFSSLCHAATITLLFLSVIKIDPKHKWGILGGVLTLAFAGLFWLYSGITEVMALGNLFVASIIYCCVRWKTTDKESLRLVIITAALVGLGVSHLHSIIMLIPGLIVCLFERPTQKNRVMLIKKYTIAASVSALFFILGSLTIIPLNNRQQSYSWHFESTPKGWWNMVTRQDYQGAFPDKGMYAESAYLSPKNNVLKSTESYTKTLWNQFGGILVLVPLLGIVFSIQAINQVKGGMLIMWLFSGILFGVYTTYTATNPTLSDKLFLGIAHRQYLIGYTVLGIFAGIGGGYIQQLVGKKIFLLAIPILCLIYANKNIGIQNNNHSFELYSKNMLDTAEPNSVIICSADASCFGLMYQSIINKYRPDVTILSKITKSRYNFLVNNAEYIGYFFGTSPYFYTQEVVWNAAIRPTYLTNLDQYYNDYIGLEGNPFYTIPKGLLYQITTMLPATTPSQTGSQEVINAFLNHPRDQRDYLTTGNADYIASVCKNAAQRYIRLNQSQAAITAMECSLSLSETSDVKKWRTYLDTLIKKSPYAAQKQLTASDYLQNALKESKVDNLASAYEFARKASYLEPRSIEPLKMLLNLYQQNGYTDQAKDIQNYIDTLETRFP